MIYFNARNSIGKKLKFSITIAAIFAFGLFISVTNKDIFSNYKSYYFRSYFYALGYDIKEVLSWSKATYVSGNAASTTLYAESVPILLYHGLLDSNPSSEASNVDLSRFWDHMKTLKEAGWQTVTMQDFYDFKTGKKQLPAKSFLLTFDDGRKDSYFPSAPLLKALGFHAVMFVIDKYSLEENSKYYLTKDELEEMSKSPNWEIQSHGYSSHSEYAIDSSGTKGHFFSNKLWIPEVGRVETTDEFIVRTTNDLQKAKDNLEAAFNKPIIAFAFPFGDHGEETVNFPGAEKIITEEVGHIYPLGFYQYSSIYRYSQNYVEPGSENGSYLIKRIGMQPQWTGKDILKIFESGKAKSLPFTAKFDQSDGWVNTTWGTMDLSGNKLTIGSLKDSTGSTVVLDGTNTWTDYQITAKVRWIKGSNIYLAARYRDDNNLAMCNFKRDLVHVEQVYKGELRVISGVNNEFDPKQDPFTVRMKVEGRKVTCSIGEKDIVSSSFLEEPLSSGGVGVKTWDSIPGNSKLEVLNLTVDPIK